MGVQNLWMLLAPVGRQIEIETLASNVLAVDASIWLTQFIKAMRDDDGNMIKNAHLIGTFHRVAKLLFYRIRPVFVFDGSTPEIKKRTVARRRKRQEHQAANLKQTAQRILLNRLKLYREELKKNGGKPVKNAAVAANFILPPAAAKKDRGDQDEDKSNDTEPKRDGVIMIDDSDEEKESATASGEETASTVAGVLADGEQESKSDGDDDDEDDEMTVDDIVLNTSRASDIDLDAVFELPGHLQKDMIARIQRDRRQEARDQFIPLAGNPEAYSRTQIASFLKTSQLNKQILKATKKNVQREMEKAAAEATAEGGDNLLAGHGRRIASNSDRFFIYEKAKEADAGSDNDEAPGSMKAALVRGEAAGWKLTSSLEQAVEEENDEDIFDRIHGSKRRHRYLEADTVIAKKPLTDFSIESIKDFTEELGRSQRRKIAVEEARRKFLEKTNYKEPETFPPAERIHKHSATPTKAEELKIENNEITIAFRAEDLGTLDTKAEALFPSSLFEKQAENLDAGSKPAADLSTGDDDDDDDLEWEDVPVLRLQNNPAPTPSAQHLQVESVDFRGEAGASAVDSDEPRTLVASGSVKDVYVPDYSDGVELEDVPQESSTKWNSGTSNVKAIELVDSESDGGLEPEASDLYTSLRHEMDEENAEEDLTALKEEALQSAIATASNLTQWAAGAVRRALEQHSRNVETSASSPKVSIERPPRKQTSPVINDGSGVIDLSQADVVNLISSPAVADDSSGAKAGDVDDTLLQLAIEKSMAASESSGPTRYLQYAAPPEPEPAVDIEAITDEQRELKKLRNRQQRDTEGVSDDMVEDVMELLQLFGVPYLVCPMEAEAQCAALEQLGLVDGIITDDSDIFPFGGKRIYKNIFHNQKFVEAFLASDVEKELGFTQEEMISLALLLGSDYTDGVRGIGIVNASEVVAAYPGLDGLKDFKEWVQTFDVAEEARRREDKKKSQAELDEMTPRERFEYTHANMRRKWELGEEFPNARVIQAYKTPQVDRSDARFSWELPNLAGLRQYCTKTFGWDQAKTDTVLLPLMEQIALFANERHRQTRIDHFFTKYDDNVKYAKIHSKRLRSAVEDKTGKTQSSAKQAAKPLVKRPKNQQKTPSSVRATNSKFTKTKKTTSTLGL